MKNLFAISSILLLAVISSGNKALAQPRFIRPGDKVAVIAPSYSSDTASVRKGLDVLRRWGLDPVLGPNVGNTDEGMGCKASSHYAATAAQRAADIKWAFEADSIKAIICTRGGYGAIHLLDSIPLETYAAHPKWLVGYSDITTLHSALTCAGIPSIHGNMVGAYGKGENPDTSSVMVRDLLYGLVPSYEVEPHRCNIEGHAEGTLTGGNFITFAALDGSSYDALDKEGGVILFIEEVEESYHAIDRIFNALMVQGKMKNVKGIIFGEFTKCGQDLPYTSVEDMLYTYTKNLGIPVCCGFQGGHGKVNLPLIMGAKTTLDVTPEGASIRFSL